MWIYRTINCLTFIILTFITGNYQTKLLKELEKVIDNHNKSLTNFNKSLTNFGKTNYVNIRGPNWPYKLPYGAPCEQDKHCQDDWVYGPYSFEDADRHSSCDNSRCACHYKSVPVFKNNNYVCLRKGGSVTHHYQTVPDDAPHCEAKDTETCINGKCYESGLKISFGNECECNDGFVYDGINCIEFVNVGFSEDCKSPESGPVPVCNYDSMLMCNSDGKCDCYKNYLYDEEINNCTKKEAFIEKYPEKFIVGLNERCHTYRHELPKNCNETAGMSCQNNWCKCTKKFYPVEANKTCESKESYVKKHNLTSYQVMPGVYCLDDSECIPGLDCKNKTCACPQPCIYDKTTSHCDCGEVSALEGAKAAIIVGCIGGAYIIFVWGHFINKTIKRGKEKQSNRQGEPRDDTEPTNTMKLSQIVKILNKEDSKSAPVSNPAPATVPLSYPIATPSYFTAPVGLCGPTDPLPDATQQAPSQFHLYSTGPVSTPDYSTSPFAFESSTNTPYTPNQAQGYISDPTPAQYPGAGPSAYPISGPSAPPVPSSATHTGTSDPPVFDINKPIIGYTSDPIPPQYPGAVPSAYPITGPSAPPAPSSVTHIGPSEPPPSNIYKPII